MSSEACTHLDQIKDDIVPSANGCEECLKMGSTWVHLQALPDVRTCRVAAIRRRIVTPPNIFTPPDIRSFDPFSRVKIGRGVTSTKFF